MNVKVSASTLTSNSLLKPPQDLPHADGAARMASALAPLGLMPRGLQEEHLDLHGRGRAPCAWCTKAWLQRAAPPEMSPRGSIPTSATARSSRAMATRMAGSLDARAAFASGSGTTRRRTGKPGLPKAVALSLPLLDNCHCHSRHRRQRHLQGAPARLDRSPRPRAQQYHVRPGHQLFRVGRASRWATRSTPTT